MSTGILHIVTAPPDGLLAQQALQMSRMFVANTAQAPENYAKFECRTDGAYRFSTNGPAPLQFLRSLRVAAAGKNEAEAKFDGLVDRWQRETRLKSRAADIVMNDAYQRIMAMGPQVLPFIFRAMRKEGDQPRYWFWALERLTDANIVVQDNDRGDSVKMRALWLKWADDNGYAV